MNQIKSKLDIENNYELRQKLDIDYNFLKKYWKIILEYDGEQKNTEFYCPKLKRRIRKFDVLDHVLNLDNQLGEAYYLKNKFLIVINASTLENIEKNLLEWIKEVNSSMVRDYDVAIETILYWKQEIINSFILNPKTGNTMTNASTEGTNNFCKVVKRVSYGYRDFNLMRARILYCNRKNIVFKSQSIKDN